MAAVYPELDERLTEFVTSQPMFFVATAPSLGASGAGGHVNVSPKGYRDTFAVIDPLTVAYLDLTGSGAETVAHLRQNGRITLMFCSFGRAPKILRLYGTGEAVLPDSPRWPGLARLFPAEENGTGDDGAPAAIRPSRGDQRAIIVVSIDRVSDSCGYGVPVMDLVTERDLLTRWAENKTPEQLAAYRVERNSVSIDGLPAIG